MDPAVHSRRRLPALVALVAAVLAGVLAPAAVVAYDVRELLFDTDRWVESTRPVLADDDTRQALAHVVVDRAAASVGCRGLALSILVASPLGDSARQRLAVRLSDGLDSPTARRAWTIANRSAHRRFVQAVGAGDSGPDRLLDLASLFDLAGGALDEPDGAEEGDGCGGAGSAPILDADSMHGAASTARVLHDLRWLPGALGAALLGCLLVALVAGRRSITRSLLAFALAALAVSGAAWLLAGSGVTMLVDGIDDQQERALATGVVGAALEPVRAHLLALVAAALTVGAAAVLHGRRAR